MSNKKNYSELAKLKRSHLAITNAEKDSRISDPLKQIGVSADVLGEGRNLHSNANDAYTEANAAIKKRSEAYEDFRTKSKATIKQFKIDRKKANIALLSDEVDRNKLELNKPVQQTRLKLFDMSKTFYTILSENPELLEALSKLGFTGEDIAARLEAVSEVEKAWANYMLEKGVSQNATNAKMKAIRKLSKWMTSFLAIAKEALKDEPQLVEALGIVVKN
ncbi:hypothetical protein ACFLRQ_00475 [Bacteroidota bacterium]